MPRPQRKLSLKARAIQWLAQREHSRTELRRKLLAQVQKEDPSMDASVEPLLDELERDGLLSGERFVASRVRTRMNRFGARRIQIELTGHGVALPAAIRNELQESEHSRAKALWSRRYGGIVSNDAKERARQGRFLRGRGFAADVVSRVIGGESSDDDTP